MTGKITDYEFTPYPKYTNNFTAHTVLPETSDVTLTECVPIDGKFHQLVFTRKDGVETYFLDGVELKGAYQPIIEWRESYETLDVPQTPNKD